MHAWIFVTGFGDQAVVLPLAALVFIWLAAVGARRPTLAWIQAVVLCGIATVVLKLYFLSGAISVSSIQSPSGHTSMSTLVYGGIGLILAAEMKAWQRTVAAATGSLVIAGIALSRVVLKAHDMAEIAIGLVVGALALTIFARDYLSHRPDRAPLWPFAAIALAALLLHGYAFTVEPWLREFAGLFAGHLTV